ncbi:MAG: GNAT family protein [Acidimicrobiia bacterium]|jgi:RimJ/RimL family protein N-acetyltransferase
MTTGNEYGQPIGARLTGWSAPPLPGPTPLDGRTVALEPLSSEDHGDDLWGELSSAPESLWTYMTFGPFPDRTDFRETIDSILGLEDWRVYAFLVGGRPKGFAAYLRINPPDGVIEIGSIVFSPAMQRTTAATESIYLMLRHAFELGYRRCEWKCDALNQPSRQAADRLGFTYEGIFRQATHYKGRNRDTAWYAIIDTDWPVLDRAFQKWLSPENFDADGQQIRTLKEMRQQP